MKWRISRVEVTTFEPLLLSLASSRNPFTLLSVFRLLYLSLALSLLIYIASSFVSKLADPSDLLEPFVPTMSTAALKHLKVAPKEAHKATVIFLHVGFAQYLAREVRDADVHRAWVIAVGLARMSLGMA